MSYWRNLYQKSHAERYSLGPIALMVAPSTFFETVGLQVKFYPYYDINASIGLFDEMMSTLEGMKDGDVLLLHGSCHNPTGEDLTPDMWHLIGQLCAAKGSLPFVDVAYQGYGDGIEEDVRGTRIIAQEVPEMILVVSSSKSFTVYCERAGLLSLIFNEKGAYADNALRLLRDVARDTYFMPPEYGAAIVAEILADRGLTMSWRAQMRDVRNRIHGLRRRVKNAFHLIDLPGDYLTRQKGMFSCLPISEHEQSQMEAEHRIFMLPNARLNFAALNEDKIDRVVQ